MTPITRICTLLISYEYLRSTGMGRAEAVSRAVMATAQCSADIEPLEPAEPVEAPSAHRPGDLEVARKLSPMLWYGAASRRMVPDPDVVH
jgi:hypothetical protein